MKALLTLGLVSIILIAGCTQQQPQANSNLTQVSDNASKNVKTGSGNVLIRNAGVYVKSGTLPAGSLSINVHNGENDSIILKYANATINGVEVGWGFLNGYDFSTTGDFSINSQTPDADMMLKAIVTSGKWVAPDSYPISFNVYYTYDGQLMVSTGEISNQLSWS